MISSVVALVRKKPGRPVLPNLVHPVYHCYHEQVIGLCYICFLAHNNMTSFFSTSALFERVPLWPVRFLDWLFKQPIPMRACLYRHAYLRKYSFYVYDTSDNVVLLIHYSS